MIRTISFEGLLYRALNPRWAVQPLSGEGAAAYGGRFNAKGSPALYTALSPVTAMKEAQQVGSFQPITLVAYRARIDRLLDGRDKETLAALGIDARVLAASDWREAMQERRAVPTQEFAKAMAGQGIQALLVPSYAPAASTDDHNIVLWRWNVAGGAELAVIDDDGRLGSP